MKKELLRQNFIWGKMKVGTELDKFKNDVARFSGQYPEFLIIVRTKSSRLQWKATDRTWAIGAAMRYLNCAEEWDRKEERDAMKDSEEDKSGN